MFKQKTVKYRLTGETNKLTMKVVDILGHEYTIERKGYISLDWYPEVHYKIKDKDFEYLQSVLLEEGIEVEKDTWALLAKVTLLKEEKITTTEVVERDYWFFKPRVKYVNRITCEEVIDGTTNSTTA